MLSLIVGSFKDNFFLLLLSSSCPSSSLFREGEGDIWGEEGMGGGLVRSLPLSAPHRSLLIIQAVIFAPLLISEPRALRK